MEVFADVFIGDKNMDMPPIEVGISEGLIEEMGDGVLEWVDSEDVDEEDAGTLDLREVVVIDIDLSAIQF